MAYDADEIEGDNVEGANVAEDKLAKVHEQAMVRFDASVLPCIEERALALEDRRFVTIAGAQWEGLWGDQWENSIKVEVNKTAMGVEKIIEDYRENRFIVNFRGVGKGADEETADTLDGMFRADFYVSQGQQAVDNAFEEAVQGGIGAWRLVNRYDDELDPENDEQRIAFEMIADADQCVFWDMNARLYDKSDAKFCFVVTNMTRQAFLAEYGEEKATAWPTEVPKTHYDWYTPDTVAVCEYYVIEEVKNAVQRVYRHRATQEERREWAADLTAEDATELEAEGWRLVRTNRRTRRQVCKYVMSGAEVLEPKQVIAGELIPVIPVYGKRWFIDNMERSRGHVRLAKDPQRIYNAQITKLTETSSLAPREVPIVTPEQIAGHENAWAEANLNRSPYLTLNPLVDPVTGQTVASGPISTLSPPQLQPVDAALIQITAGDIESLTNAQDTSSEIRSNVSAEAMDIAATRTDAKSRIYMDNLKQSWRRCGEVWKSMARDVYFEPGREVETMGVDGEQGTATLAEPFTDDQGRHRIRNDISSGKYRVISDVTEATATRRDKTVKTLNGMAQSVAAYDPQLAGACTNVAILNMDGEGIADLQEWVRARGVTAGYVKPTKEEQEQIDQAQEGQQPDPQAQALQAVAQKESALAGKAVADTKLSEAKTVETLANAAKIQADTGRDEEDVQLERRDKKLGMVDRVRSMFAPKDQGAKR